MKLENGARSSTEISIEITYKQKIYAFEYGSEAFIFHAGIYNDMDKKYCIQGLLDYVSFVHGCYLSDSNRTPLGTLADYIAENWEQVAK